MPEHPLAAVYVLGAYGWLAITAALMLARPDDVDEGARQTGMSPLAFRAAGMLVTALAWPLMAALIVAVARRR